MSDSVTPQLEAIISELEEKESTLSAQLDEVVKQRESLRKVIAMFEGGDSDAAIEAASSVQKKASSTKSSSTKKAATKTRKKAETTKTTATAKKTTRKKKDGRAADWQKYTLPGVKNQPMPEAVKLVLATQPDKDFKIAEVMSSLFKENMPKTQYLKARNRISNILSGGVRDGEWYKGERGAYRLNPA